MRREALFFLLLLEVHERKPACTGLYNHRRWLLQNNNHGLSHWKSK